MSCPTVRRYYLLKRLAAERRDEGELADVWKFKQLSLAWPDLPSGFPSRAALMRAGYQSVRDLDGATVSELAEIGLSHSEATAVLTAMERYTMIAKELLAPPYYEQSGNFVTAYNAPLIPSDAYDATFTGEEFEMGQQTTLRLTLDITAKSGTNPTLDTVILTSRDGQTGWRTLYTFGQKTDVGSEDVVIPGCDRFVKARGTLGGTTPSFTFSLTGEAV